MEVNTSVASGEFHYIIQGVPKVQKQTRFRIVKGQPRTYDPSRWDKGNIVSQILQCLPPKPLDMPVEMTLVFYMPIPKATPKALREKMIQRIALPDKRPDEDNLAYLVTNALKGFVYDDDKRICAKHVYKFYSDKPRTVIKVRPIWTLTDIGFPAPSES